MHEFLITASRRTTSASFRYKASCNSTNLECALFLSPYDVTVYIYDVNVTCVTSSLGVSVTSHTVHPRERAIVRWHSDIVDVECT